MNATQCLSWAALSATWSSNHPEDARWQHWLHHVLRNHLQREASAHYNLLSVTANNFCHSVGLGLESVLCLSPRDYFTNYGLVQKRYNDRCYALDVYSLDETLRRHYELGGIIYCWDDNGFPEHVLNISHLYEALSATQDRSSDWSRISVKDAIRISDDWVKQLNRNKNNLTGKTECVWRHKHTSLEVPMQTEDHSCDLMPEPVVLEVIRDWKLHLLLDEEAYQAEGFAMHHCVASYWGTSDNKIYSLRCEGKRRATIEIQDKVISFATTSANKSGCVQIRGYRNDIPDSDALAVADIWFAENNIVKMSRQDIFVNWNRNGYFNQLLGLASPLLWENREHEVRQDQADSRLLRVINPIIPEVGRLNGIRVFT